MNSRSSLTQSKNARTFCLPPGTCRRRTCFARTVATPEGVRHNPPTTHGHRHHRSIKENPFVAPCRLPKKKKKKSHKPENRTRSTSGTTGQRSKKSMCRYMEKTLPHNQAFRLGGILDAVVSTAGLLLLGFSRRVNCLQPVNPSLPIQTMSGPTRSS